MKIFGWMQNKFNARHGNHNKQGSISVHNHKRREEPQKEEFSDWPCGLLAIGTFGNNDRKEDSKQNHFQESHEDHHHQQQEELTPEGVELQNELNLLSDSQVKSTCDEETDAANDSGSDKFLDSLASFANDRTECGECPEDCSINNKDRELLQSTSLVLSRGKNTSVADNATINAAINKKSLSFLLKKMFVCGGGFAPAPSLRDQVHESKMEKILRATLHKKIYPQTLSQAFRTKKCLQNKHQPKFTSNEDEKTDEKADNNNNNNNNGKWVKTDSEYIVLEI